MKAILITDMPKCCEMCCLSIQVAQGSLCLGTRRDKDGKKVNGCFGTMPSWCPLKPLPNKIELGYPCEKYDEGYSDGWNDCLDEILGEDDEL